MISISVDIHRLRDKWFNSSGTHGKLPGSNGIGQSYTEGCGCFLSQWKKRIGFSSLLFMDPTAPIGNIAGAAWFKKSEHVRRHSAITCRNFKVYQKNPTGQITGCRYCGGHRPRSAAGGKKAKFECGNDYLLTILVLVLIDKH